MNLLEENSNFEAYIWGVKSVSSENPHDFEIIWSTRGMGSPFPPPPLPHLYFGQKYMYTIWSGPNVYSLNTDIVPK